MSETPRKGHVSKITSFFTPRSNPVTTPLKTRSRTAKLRSPSPPPLKEPPVQNNNQPLRETLKRKIPREEPFESSEPKSLKMGNPSKKKDDKGNTGATLEENAEPPSTTLDELKSILIDKFDYQEQRFSESFKAQEAKLQEALAQHKTHLEDLTDPII